MPPLEAPDPDEDGGGADGLAAETETSLVATAKFLFEKRKRHIITNLDVIAEGLGITRKTLKRRWHALAESALQVQNKLVDGVLSYIKGMSGINIEPCCFIHYAAFDETPLRLRLEGESTAEKLKVFVIQQRWSALVKQKDTGVTGDSSYLSLHGGWSPMVRAVDAGTGEGVRNVLLSCQHDSQDLWACGWKHVIRLVETDNLSANLRAERLYKATQNHELKTMHVVCVAHQVHSAAARTFDFMAPTISSIIACCKVLGEGGMRHKLREHMQAAIPRWVRRVQTNVRHLDDEAVNFRRSVLACITHQGESPRLSARMSLLAEVLNGDWRERGHLSHLCSGTGCCQSHDHCVNKCLSLLPKALTTMCRMFCRGNWSGWPAQLAFFLATAIHGFLGSMLLSVFQSRGPEDDPLPVCAGDRDVENMAPAQGEPAVNMEPWELERREKARCHHQAVSFLSQPGWVDDLLLLRGALEPQVAFMKNILFSTSLQSRLQECEAMAREGACVYAAERVIGGQWFEEMLRGCYTQLMTLGQHLPSTEAFRTRVLQLCYKQAGVVAILVRDKYHANAMPWKLLGLLKDRSAPRCQEILDLPRCCHDEFSLGFVEVYNSVGLLQSEQAQHVLGMVAGHLSMTTFQVERMHSQNLRRRNLRTQTHDLDVADLAAPHCAESGNKILLSHIYPELPCPAKKLGRPKKQKDDSQRPRKHRRLGSSSGGGGPWRAFIHFNHKNAKMSSESIKAAQHAYRNLSRDDHSFFQNLGRAGLWKGYWHLTAKEVTPLS